jgi:hypothetical protein
MQRIGADKIMNDEAGDYDWSKAGTRKPCLSAALSNSSSPSAQSFVSSRRGIFGDLDCTLSRPQKIGNSSFRLATFI